MREFLNAGAIASRPVVPSLVPGRRSKAPLSEGVIKSPEKERRRSRGSIRNRTTTVGMMTQILVRQGVFAGGFVIGVSMIDSLTVLLWVVGTKLY